MRISRGSVRYHLRRAYLGLRRRISATLVDRRRGIETSREENLDDFGLHAAERVRYEPSAWVSLRRILPTTEVDRDDVFVDIGAGKGRVVLEAAVHYPFQRVIGVEISPELTAVAEANVTTTTTPLRCDSVELISADVLEYELPPDVTVIYMYNSFRGDIFNTFAARLVAALDASPRAVRIIYNTPMEHDALMATGRFRVVREARALRPSRAWSRKLSIRMYEFVPAATPADPAGPAPAADQVPRVRRRS